MGIPTLAEGRPFFLSSFKSSELWCETCTCGLGLGRRRLLSVINGLQSAWKNPLRTNGFLNLQNQQKRNNHKSTFDLASAIDIARSARCFWPVVRAAQLLGP
jgi:hypothetical protein